MAVEQTPRLKLFSDMYAFRHYLEVLRTISVQAVTESTSDKYLSKIVKIVSDELYWDVCSIYILEPDSNELVLAATYGLFDKSIGKVRLPVSEGLVGFSVREEKSIFLDNAQDDPRYRYFPETGEEKYKSLAAVPFYQEGKVSGVLTVQTVSPYKFSTADKHFLDILSSQIGQAVDVSFFLKDPNKNDTHILLGKPASLGIGTGRVHIIDYSNERLEILARGFGGADFELKLFENAVKLALSEIDSLIIDLKNTNDPGANIFFAQRTILVDPEFQRKINEDITTFKKSAPRAVAHRMDEYIKKFSSFENKKIREKAYDIKDIRDTLLRNMGEKVTQFAPEFEEEEMIVVAQDLTPQETVRLDTDKVVAIVTEMGSNFSHASILAKSLQIPAVVAVSGLLNSVEPGDILLVDGNSGFVYLNPDSKLKGLYESKLQSISRKLQKIRSEATRTKRKKTSLSNSVFVDANIGLPLEIEKAKSENLGSVGLLRTEFFYMKQQFWPDEEVQSHYYSHVLSSFPKGIVTIRLLDIGGDKSLSYIPYLQEDNSYFGTRSVRLLLDNPEILRSQLRSIHLSVTKCGLEPRILVPMVTHAWEIKAVREVMLEVTGGKAYPLGAMVEIPAAVFQVAELCNESDFVSIGTNDLSQYLLAVDRNNSRVGHLYHPLNIAVIRALDYLFNSLNGLSKDFSVCGEMAGDPISALALLVIGYRHLSLSPSRLPEINYMLDMIPDNILPSLREPLLSVDDPKESEKLLRKVIRDVAPLLYKH